MMKYLCPKCSYKGQFIVKDANDAFITTKKCCVLCAHCDYLLDWRDFLDDGKELPAALDIQIGGNHYKDYAIQPIEFFMANKLTYDVCATIKYVMRHQNKNGKEDLEKAKHTIDIMIEHYYGEER